MSADTHIAQDEPQNLPGDVAVRKYTAPEIGKDNADRLLAKVFEAAENGYDFVIYDGQFTEKIALWYVAQALEVTVVSTPFFGKGCTTIVWGWGGIPGDIRRAMEDVQGYCIEEHHGSVALKITPPEKHRGPDFTMPTDLSRPTVSAISDPLSIIGVAVMIMAAVFIIVSIVRCVHQ